MAGLKYPMLLKTTWQLVVTLKTCMRCRGKAECRMDPNILVKLTEFATLMLQQHPELDRLLKILITYDTDKLFRLRKGTLTIEEVEIEYQLKGIPTQILTGILKCYDDFEIIEGNTRRNRHAEDEGDEKRAFLDELIENGRLLWGKQSHISWTFMQFAEYLDERMHESIDVSDFHIQGLSYHFNGSEHHHFPSEDVILVVG